MDLSSGRQIFAAILKQDPRSFFRTAFDPIPDYRALWEDRFVCPTTVGPGRGGETNSYATSLTVNSARTLTGSSQ